MSIMNFKWQGNIYGDLTESQSDISDIATVIQRQINKWSTCWKYCTDTLN